MLLLRTDSLPSGQQWLYELKLDGYRAVAFKRNGAIHLRSRNDNDFNARYPAVVEALAKLPDNTVIDGEVVAFDQEGRPSFHALRNYGSAPAPVVYYVFDMMVLAGQDVMREPLQKRRELLEKKVLPKLPEPVLHPSLRRRSLRAAIEQRGHESQPTRQPSPVAQRCEWEPWRPGAESRARDPDADTRWA
jgi:ATP-dependent DNA ligase